jgi:hypothetical protein
MGQNPGQLQMHSDGYVVAWPRSHDDFTNLHLEMGFGYDQYPLGDAPHTATPQRNRNLASWIVRGWELQSLPRTLPTRKGWKNAIG